MVQTRNNSKWKVFFFILRFFWSDRLLPSMKNCYFGAMHLTICLTLRLNMQKKTKVGQQELTDFHSCPEQHTDQQKVREISLFPLIYQFSHCRNTIHLKPVSGAFCVFFSCRGKFRLQLPYLSPLCSNIYGKSPLWTRPCLTRLLLEVIKDP